MFDIVNFFSNEEQSNIIRVGDPKAIDKFYAALKRDYNIDEMKDILDCDENMLINSCAGAGKTTTLILKLLRDFLVGKFQKKSVINGVEVQTTSRILVSTFLKSGAVELSQKFRELIQKYNIKGIDVNSVFFRTLHGEVYSSLKEMGVSPNIINEADTYKYIKKACKDYGIHSVMGGRKKDLTNEEISDISCILTYARNRLDNSKYQHPLMEEYNIHEIELKAVLEEFKLLKAKDNVQDFEDLEEILYDGYSKFPKVIQYIKSKYDYVYLDEFQDTSQLQYAILEPYLKGAKGFIAVGDEDQCLREGTEVFTKGGMIPIQRLRKGMFVLSAIGRNNVKYCKVDNVSKKRVLESLVVLRTKTGKILKGTKEHIMFVRSSYNYIGKNNIDYKQRVYFTDNSYVTMYLGDIVKGFILPIYDGNKIIEDEVIEVSKEHYNGYVYDISVPETHNFIANNIVVHNCIYSWRGSDVSLIQEKFEKDYNPVVKKLTINRRCLENILLPVIPSIEQNTNRHKKDLKASDKGGRVEIIVDGGAGYLMKSVREDLKKSEKIGILARTNADLLIPAVLLEIDGYSSFSLSNSVSLKDRIPTQVLGIMDLLARRYDLNFEIYFKMFLNKYNSYEATKLVDTLSSNLDYNIYNMDLGDLEYSAPSLFSIIRMLRKICKYNEETKQFEGDRKKAYINLLDIIEQDVFNGKTIYAQRARDFTYYIKKIITSHDRVKDLTFDELYKLFRVDLPNSLEKKQPQKAKRIKQSDGSWIIQNPPPDNSFVKITTVHDAKGKQWDNVYIWNDVDGCFPNTVGSRELTKEEFEEERRIHYIAWTRAVKKLTVFTRSDRLDGFLKECNLTNNVDIIELNENKPLTNFVKDMSAKESLQSNSKLDIQIDWKSYIKEYFKKYTSYENICTKKGINLDTCVTKLNGFDNLIKKLEFYKLERYPVNYLDTVISDILESMILNDDFNI